MKTDKNQAALSKSYPILRTYAVVSAGLSLAYMLIIYFTYGGQQGNLNFYILLSANITLSALFAWYFIRAKNKKFLVLVLKALLLLDAISVPLQIVAGEYYVLAPTAMLALVTYVTLKKVNESTSNTSS